MKKPDNTAVRTALWRAMHVQVDSLPHIIEDEIGLKLVAPDTAWRERPDMNPYFTARARGSIVGRARFIEDLITEQSERGVGQYVLLGAGLDTFAQRKPEIATKLQIFEIDQPDTQIWKQQRLRELGFDIPNWLHFVSVNFENSSWWEQLLGAGFDEKKPAVISSTGVSMYLSKEAVLATFRQIAALVPGSKLVMTYMLPLELLEEQDKKMHEISEKGARASGTPFISYFTPDEIVSLARQAGFNDVETISAKEISKRYFSQRSDKLTPASNEEILLATT